MARKLSYIQKVQKRLLKDELCWIYLCICLSVCPSLPIHPSIHPSIHPPTHPPTHCCCFRESSLRNYKKSSALRFTLIHTFSFVSKSHKCTCVQRLLECYIGTLNVHELFWMLQCNLNASVEPNQEWWIYLFRPRFRLGFCAKLDIAVHKWTRETLSWVDPYIWCKLNKLLR